VSAGDKVSLNAPERRSGPGNLSLERSGCKVIGFHSRNVRSWASKLTNLRYSNLSVNKSVKFYIFYNVEFFLQNCKKKQHEIVLNTFSRSLII